jgi:hypothetical protein
VRRALGQSGGAPRYMTGEDLRKTQRSYGGRIYPPGVAGRPCIPAASRRSIAGPGRAQG